MPLALNGDAVPVFAARKRNEELAFAHIPGGLEMSTTKKVRGVEYKVCVLHTMLKRGNGLHYTPSTTHCTLVYVVNTGRTYVEPVADKAERAFQVVSRMTDGL